jgi:16S rRNA (cytosine1402-N4)-methyltransferase
MGPVQTLLEMKNEISHYPVMYRQVLDFLQIEKRSVIVDCTVGMGSHSLRFIEKMRDGATLIGMDKDEESLAIAAERLLVSGKNVKLIKSDFSQLDVVFKNLGVEKADAFLFDLGISTYQLSRSERGFSFLQEGPLDMRMDKDAFLSAYDLVNNLSEKELTMIFQKFGEERYSKRISHFIVEQRRMNPFYTTQQLADLIMRTVPHKAHSYRIHPATRVFQALRIAVNRELEMLQAGLEKALTYLQEGGRVAVMSFHSLEDRIVKHTFKNHASRKEIKILTKKPLVPGEEELRENNRSRSAKLRAAEKL